MPTPGDLAMFANEQNRHEEQIRTALRRMREEIDRTERSLDMGHRYLGDGARQLVTEAGRLVERCGAWDALKAVEPIVKEG